MNAPADVLMSATLYIKIKLTAGIAHIQSFNTMILKHVVVNARVHVKHASLLKHGMMISAHVNAQEFRDVARASIGTEKDVDAYAYRSAVDGTQQILLVGVDHQNLLFEIFL